SEIPVISGIGHETDFTLTDFAADLRAPTPTAAAELATPDKVELLAEIMDYRQNLSRIILETVQEKNWQLYSGVSRLKRNSPLNKLRTARQQVDELARRIGLNLAYQVELNRTRLTGMNQHLTALSPHGILARGFAVVTNQDGDVVKSSKAVKEGERINIQVSDGEIGAEVVK
ncbi:MAG: exodeoxyribonuclease VII large subunit, partial [Chloroflexota bacterium]